MFMPSSVMLTALCGRPLILASRMLPSAVVTPGRKPTRSNAARPCVGRLTICCWVMVVETLVCVVFRISLAASTTTVSATPPGVRVGLIFVGTPAFSRTSSRSAVENPFMETVTLYSPGSSAGMVNRPSPPETAVDEEAVALFLATMVAPGMTAPDESKTVPESVAVTPPWADALRGVTATPISSKTTAPSMDRDFIFPPVRRFPRPRALKLGNFATAHYITGRGRVEFIFSPICKISVAPAFRLRWEGWLRGIAALLVQRDYGVYAGRSPGGHIARRERECRQRHRRGQKRHRIQRR